MGEVIPGMIRWSGLKRRTQVLDRVFSSSQPNLCCSAVDSLPSSAPCSSPSSIASTPEPGSTLRRLRDHLLPHSRAAQGRDGSSQQAGTKSPRAPAVCGHQLTHQKSSSLPGTDCIEHLLRPAISTRDSNYTVSPLLSMLLLLLALILPWLLLLGFILPWLLLL
ncbi:Hypothetical predicted protein [Pelobates cultripes]|uniref:Uncharacterized protein n=1 Tax=Pelobates cultripes TaxID=61616 RepID=A0AAD1WC59_PELCU|nr:Hypothetical predicted protein [Pelobates cultripes]